MVSAPSLWTCYCWYLKQRCLRSSENPELCLQIENPLVLSYLPQDFVVPNASSRAQCEGCHQKAACFREQLVHNFSQQLQLPQLCRSSSCVQGTHWAVASHSSTGARSSGVPWAEHPALLSHGCQLFLCTAATRDGREEQICFKSCTLVCFVPWAIYFFFFLIWKNNVLTHLLCLAILLLFRPALFPISLYLQKNPEEDSSGKTLSWEPGHLLLTIYTVRSIEQLLPFFNVLSQVFNSKVTSRCAGHSGSPVLYPNCFPSKDIKMENLKTFSSKARQKIEEMVEKDFLEGVIKT